MSMTESSKKRKRKSKTSEFCSRELGISSLRRGPWTPEEDELLSSYIKREGEGQWRTLPKMAGLLRCGKSCRLRWMNYLCPSVKRGHFADDEEDLILRLHRLLGNRWSLIAGRIPGRTDNDIKNYWNTHLRKKLISQGIDPRTHKPLDANNLSIVEYNQHKQASSSKPNSFASNPNPNLATSSSSREETPMIVAAKSDLICNNDQLGNNLHEYDESANELDNDDIFSVFLNSLINEDLFNVQIEEPSNADPAFGSGSVDHILPLMPDLHRNKSEPN